MMNLKIQKAEDGKNAGSAKKCVQTGKKEADKKEADKKETNKKEANKKQAAQVAVFENPEFGTVRTATDEKGGLGSVRRICVMCSGIREQI